MASDDETAEQATQFRQQALSKDDMAQEQRLLTELDRLAALEDLEPDSLLIEMLIAQARRGGVVTIGRLAGWISALASDLPNSGADPVRRAARKLQRYADRIGDGDHDLLRLMVLHAEHGGAHSVKAMAATASVLLNKLPNPPEHPLDRALQVRSKQVTTGVP